MQWQELDKAPGFAEMLADGNDCLLVYRAEEDALAFCDRAVEASAAIGGIGRRWPLLANIDLLENVLLNPMYVHNRSLADGLREISRDLAVLELDEVTHLRRNALTSDQVFRACLLRAVAADKHALILDRAEPRNYQRLRYLLSAMGRRMACWVACFHRNAAMFEGLGLAKYRI